ncbi:ATP-binding cassette domain-containing protein [Streptomyces sp. NPDC018321]|uniref:ATP-binding cassette domain-containing protein n=1 Tax=unclassified Streptomyces TaxID=2593676 RepID=UPI003796E4A8
MKHTSREVAIEVRNLTRVFPAGGSDQVVKANDDLTFSIPRGQVFGLLGANGAGKTTLVSQLLGLMRPTSGQILVEGIDAVAHPDEVKAMTGFLPQTGLSMRLVEVRRALHYTGRLRGQPEADARRQTAELIDELGLGEVRDRYVDQLSGGMTRLVNFGMALMGRPKLLVLDEPTNELDPHNRRRVWEMVARRSVEDGTTVVLVTHNMLEAESAVDQVGVMDGGRITAMGTPASLKEALGDRVRLELSVRGAGELARHERELLAGVGEVGAGKRDGSYLVQTDSARMPELMRLVRDELGMDRVADFRLTRPTLEDVYLTLDGRGAAAGTGPGAGPGAEPAAPGGPVEAGRGVGPAGAARPAVAPVASASGMGAAAGGSVPEPAGPVPAAADRAGPGPLSAAPAGPGRPAVAPAASVARDDRRAVAADVTGGPVAASTPATSTPATTGTAATAPATSTPVATGAAGAAPVALLVREGTPVPDAGGDAGPVARTGAAPARRGAGERLRRMGTDLKYLWLEQMLEVRSTWSWVLMFGLLMPAAMVFGLTRIGNGLSDEESLLFIVSGAAVFSVANEGIGTLAQRIGVLRQDGMMVYYASLPISRISFLAAMVFSRLLLIMPGLITPMITAKLMYDTDFVISPALLLVLPLACLALSAIGLAIGTLVRSMDLLLVIVNLMIFVLLLVAPVLIPIESLPVPLQVFGYLLPPTYAAEALRLALVGDLGSAFLLNIAVLTAMTAAGLAGASRWIRWRTA